MAVDVGGPSKTQQHQADAVDLNKIVARHGEDVWKRFDLEGVYGDATGPRDLQAAFDLVEEQERLFLTLPAHVRSAAENNPVRLLEMLESPEDAAELLELGLPEDALPSSTLDRVVEARQAAAEQATPNEAPAEVPDPQTS